MRAVGLVFWAHLRHRWRSWLAIAILISLVGGVIMAAAAAGRRTESAFPSFVATHGFDTEVYSTQPAPEIHRLPGVSAVTEAFGPDNGQPTCACSHPLNASYFGVLVLPAKDRPAFTLMSGRFPDPSNPYEVLASYTLQQDEGVHLGTIINVPFYAPSQSSAYNSAIGGATPKPSRSHRSHAGGRVRSHRVRLPIRWHSLSTASTPPKPSPAPCCLRPPPATSYFVRLRRGRLTSLDSTRPPALLGEPPSRRTKTPRSHPSKRRSIPRRSGGGSWPGWPPSSDWWLSVRRWARQSIIGEQRLPDDGGPRRRASTARAARHRTQPRRGAGRGIRGGGDRPASFLQLRRSARRASPIGSTGISFDWLVLTVGVLVTVVVVIALGIWPSVRAARRRPARRAGRPRVGPPRLASSLWSIGAPPSVVIGVRNALERRSGGANVPVGSALLGTVLAVIALCGTAVFGASLSHLTTTPALYGILFSSTSRTRTAAGRRIPALLHAPRT